MRLLLITRSGADGNVTWASSDLRAREGRWLMSSLGERVAVRRAEGRGRCLVATARLRAGEEVLATQPYASCLNDDQRATRCDHTFASAEDVVGGALLRCSRSKVARYASREAQAAAWRAGYREECAALVACAPRVPPPTVRLAARALWRRRRERAPAADDVYRDAAPFGLGEGFDAVDALEHHWDRLPDARKAAFAQMAQLVRAFMAGADPAPPSSADPLHRPDIPAPREVALLLARISCNAHTVCDEELRPVGVALYPAAAMMNHSDAPNVAQTFRGKTASFRCLRDVDEGEELTIAYVELAATRAERRAELLEGYLFDIDEDEDEDDGATAAPSTSRSDPTLERTTLPSGATMVDHGAGTPRPPWRADPIDDAHLCAVTFRGVATDGGILVLPAPRAVDDDQDQDQDRDRDRDLAAPDYSGGLLRGVGASRPGSTARRFEVHLWGSLSGADREHTAVRVAEAARLVAEAERRLADGDAAEAYRSSRRAASLVDASSDVDDVAALGPSHVLRARALSASSRAAVDVGDFEAAAVHARALAPTYRLTYPTAHPPLGLHLAVLAKLEAHLGNIRAAASAAREAAAALTTSHGVTSATAREAARVLGESEAELEAERRLRRLEEEE